MRENYRNSIASVNKFPQFTIMNVIDGQADIVIYASLIFYSLTIDNILNIIVLLILAGVSIQMLTGQNGILNRASEAKEKTEIANEEEQRNLAKLEANTNLNNTEYKGVPIPAGFAPTKMQGEDTVEDGLVITDTEGNEFVWVPCTLDGANGSVKYEKENGLATTWASKYSGYAYWYNGGEWTDNGGNSESVGKYGGFYIARYEAGLSKDSTLWQYSDGATYGKSRNVETMIPVSKKNNASWNFISQENALKVSSNMYKGSTSVTSSLVDNYAWDTIIEWISKNVDVTNSTAYGNYVNSKFSLKNVLYATHEFNYSSWSWTKTASNYSLGQINIPERSQSGTQTLYELATGTTEATKVNNIYDLAGNMWEWTTEIGHPKEDTSRNSAVLRGGGFYYDGSGHPACFRLGDVGASWSDGPHVGFRVVLYIK